MEPLAPPVLDIKRSVSENALPRLDNFSDEVVLEIFKNLNALELAKIFGVDHHFERLRGDQALVKTEISACKQMIQEFMQKNPSAPLTKRLERADFPWSTNHWRAFKACQEEYRFNDVSLDDLPLIDPPEEHVGSPPLTTKLLQRFEQRWRMQLREWEDESFICNTGISYKTGSFQGFINALPFADHIKRLVILNELDSEQVEILAQALGANKLKIRELHIDRDSGVSEQSLQHLLKSVGKNTHLKSFKYLQSIRNVDLQVLVRALQDNNTLESLSLDGSNFGMQGFQQLIQLLQQKNIKVLELRNLPDGLVTVLFAALGTIKIEELNINSEDISMASAVVFAANIKLNHNINKIQLPLKSLTEDAAQTILKAMSEHPKLKGYYMYLDKEFIVRSLYWYASGQLG